MKTFDLSLYLVLDRDLCGPPGMVATARQAAAGGATMIQLRDKTADTAGMIETGLMLKAALTGTGCLLVINDDVDAAIAIGADGLHIGGDDGDPRRVRNRIGPDMILGLSVETETMAASIDATIVDYAGIGPVFATPTKPDHKHPIGWDGLAKLVAAAPVPAVAIGGLKLAHVASVFAAGAQGLAVVSAICGQDNPEHATMLIAQAIKAARR